MNTKPFTKWVFSLLCMPALAVAQDDWRFNAEVNTMTGDYTHSQVMKKQHGLGVRLSGELQNSWGFSAGVQSTHIDMQPLVPQSTQSQNNWLVSAHHYVTSPTLVGRWQLQLDLHRVFNDAITGNSDGVTAVVPQISWASLERPIKLDLSYANSYYNNTPVVHQISPSVGFGFNDNKSWLQARGYLIHNLDPALSMGLSSGRASDVRLTQLFQSASPWVPQSITLGLERGRRIYFVDMTTQTVHNLPMRNDGGESISARWKLSHKTQFTLQLQQTCYFSNAYTAHDFNLRTLSAQFGSVW